MTFRCLTTILVAGMTAILSPGARAQDDRAALASEATEDVIKEARRAVEQAHYAKCDLSLFLAGDTILTVPWSDDDHPDFLRLIGEIRAADAAIVNLETLIHSYRGYPQADSGGTYMTSPPVIADELVWAGIDLVGHANNHTFDYGSIGVMENLEHVTAAGLLLAGSGPDLQRARAPVYFAPEKGGVALVSMASTFVPYGKAGPSRADLHGRPGLNPLTLHSGTVVTIPTWVATGLGKLARLLGFRGRRFADTEFDMWGFAVSRARRLRTLVGHLCEPARSQSDSGGDRGSGTQCGVRRCISALSRKRGLATGLRPRSHRPGRRRLPGAWSAQGPRYGSL